MNPKLGSTLALGVCVFASTLALAQNPVVFNSVNSATGGVPLTAYAIDVNNDGVPDVIQDYAYAPGTFSVSLSKGDGSFAAPVRYTVPASNATQLPMAFGDFNNDGKVDIAVGAVGTPTIYVYFGNGDGTFQSPKTDVIAFPSGQQLGAAPLAAADFNHDGKTDLVVTSNTNTVYVFAGDGTGFFVTPVSIFTAPSGQTIGDLVLGDFDSDNNADIALDYYHSSSGQIDQTVAQVFYGDGQFGFQGDWVQSLPGAVSLGAGHLDNDARTDLFALNYSTGELVTFYGSSSGRTFDAYYYTIPAADMPTRIQGFAPAIAVADFNDDNHQKDLVTVSSNGPSQSLVFFLSNGTRGQFITQKAALPSGYYRVTGPLLGDFNSDMKPDVTVIESDTTGAPGPSSAAILSTQINGTSGSTWSDCNYPHAGQGIYLCSPIGYSDPVMQVNATASSFSTIRKMELWVDGNKIAEQSLGWGHNASLNWAQQIFPDGWHNATIYAADIDNHLQRLNFGFSTGTQYTCPVPPTEGLHVCYPTSNSTSPTNVNVQLSANVPAQVYRIEVWVDGVKKFTNFNTPYVSADIQVAPGNHRFDFYAVSYNGAKWEQTVYASTK